MFGADNKQAMHLGEMRMVKAVTVEDGMGWERSSGIAEGNRWMD